MVKVMVESTHGQKLVQYHATQEVSHFTFLPSKVDSKWSAPVAVQ